MGIFDIFRKPTKNENHHERMEKIRESGKQGERHFEYDNALSRYKRVHQGADYVKYVRDSAGRTRKEPHEVKRNNSPLSKKQKKTWGLKVDRYIDTPYGVEKVTENRAKERLKQDPLTGKWHKVRKRDTSGLSSFLGTSSTKKQKQSKSIYDSFWGSNSKRKSRNNNSFENLFGSNTSSKSKRKNTSFDTVFGSGSSSKRSKSKSTYDNIWGSSKKGSKKSNASFW